MAAAVSSAPPLFQHASLEGGNSGPSILETLEQLRSAGKDQLEKEFTVRAEQRSTVRHDEWQVDLALEIPVIDLSLLQTDRAGVVKQIHEAVTEWGFFHILNHGIPLELLQGTLAHGLEFFALPSDIKRKATPQPGQIVGYNGDSSKMPGTNLFWAENLYFNSVYLKTMINQVWPDGNEAFRDTLTKYASDAEKIAKQLHELIAESLGLPTDFFARHYGRKGNTFRFNMYPACPTPMETMGIVSHSDPTCLTVLVQDNVGGLQIEKDGRWVAVKPIEGSLVVNIGDMLHAWTNGICKSVLHRGVVNKEVHRLSLAAFMYVAQDIPISAPEELIDATHPRQYRAFTIKEYRADYLSRVKEKRSYGVHVLQEDFKFEK
jgi:isopenicillin N synthase-like dioxygenase